MDCKNCKTILKDEDHFCNNCGAKVIMKRITFKLLFIDFFINIFGFDSKFFTTLRMMAWQPHLVMKDYLEGVRQRYMNPFAFLAVGAGLSLIVFNYFADDFIAINASVQTEQIKELEKQASIDLSAYKDATKEVLQKVTMEKKLAQFQLDFNKGILDFMLRYFNLLSFVILLLYATYSKWTFLKPHNYGEHVVMNAYAYGFTTYLTLIAFFFAMVFTPTIYFTSIFISIIYYMFVFGKFYELSIGRNILKLLRFLIGLIISLLIFGLLTFIIGLVIGLMGFIKFDV